MDQQGFERTVKKSADQIGASATIDVNFSDYNGWCIKTEKSDAVYFVMGGEKRYIPNMDTLNGLFSGQNIHDGTSLVGSLWTRLVEAMPSGDDITDGAQLIQSVDSDTVFLLTNGKKYGITSPQQFEACNFGWKKIHKYPAIIIDAIPNGGNDAFLRP
ncbi:hypothetical protein [Evtepia gabavorous]|uniref:hypothetical protein n=1 Tax=Evtepia gabavorous TaxID=2211183 RepID=UPI003A920B2E